MRSPHNRKSESEDSFTSDEETKKKVKQKKVFSPHRYKEAAATIVSIQQPQVSSHKEDTDKKLNSDEHSDGEQASQSESGSESSSEGGVGVSE